MIKKIKENSTLIMIVIMVLLFLKQCGVSREMGKMRKEMAQLSAVSDSIKNETATRKEIRLEMNKALFDFLIYETDLDNGKSSLSEIRSKVDKP
jgi:hypothetical protein